MIDVRAGSVPRILVFGFLLVGMLLAGCRTYGRYGNAEETLEQIRRSNDRFAEELQRARRDLDLLIEAAEEDSSLRAYAERYRSLLRAHEALLAENRELEQRLAESAASYRELHRVFHAILSEERLVRDQYASLYEAIAQQGDTTPAISDTLTPGQPSVAGRYVYVPVFYERLLYANQTLSMQEALRRQRTGEAPEVLPGGEATPDMEQDQ